MVRRIAILVVACVVSAHAQIPKLDYSSYLGGSSDESGYAIATDSAGAVYIAGFTTSPDLPVITHPSVTMPAAPATCSSRS